MVFQGVNAAYFLIFIVLIDGYRDFTSDQTSTRPNTLLDDADDIQRQLNNEARDKMLFGKPKTVWVLHLPTEFPKGIITTEPWSRNTRNFNFLRNTKKTKKPANIKMAKTWSYKDQSIWSKSYPECGGHSQSPVDLPAVGLVKTKGLRQLSFINYDVKPRTLKLNNNGQRLLLTGEWQLDLQPVVYGGAAHSRRYLFHSITLHWPSEHRVGGLQYPLESQVIHISAEYKTMEEAIKAAPHDAQAILGIVNLYKYSDHTQPGLKELLRVAATSRGVNATMTSYALGCFNPPLQEYACYQGSLTTPPCTENVLWMIRARALSVTRASVEAINKLADGELRGAFIRQTQPLNDRRASVEAINKLADGELRGAFIRQTQPLNDRRVYYFNN